MPQNSIAARIVKEDTQDPSRHYSSLYKLRSASSAHSLIMSEIRGDTSEGSVCQFIHGELKLALSWERNFRTGEP